MRPGKLPSRSEFFVISKHFTATRRIPTVILVAQILIRFVFIMMNLAEIVINVKMEHGN